MCAEFEAPRWWTEGFVSNIGEIASQKKMNAAKNYARAGHVIALNVSPGLIEARVQGHRKTPYRVRLYSPCLSKAQLEEIKNRLCEKATYRIAILSGEMPRELDAIFRAAGVPLSLDMFAKSQQLCCCSEPEDVCKHILATAYVAAVAFDRDPFLLMKFRGLDKDDLLASLCSPVGSGEAASCAAEGGEWRIEGGDCPNDDDVGRLADAPALDASYYGSAELPAALNEMERRAPEGGALAPMPDFPLWRGETSFSDAIAPYYRCVEKFVKHPKEK
jgi:uncharacterized Zn finger protein